MINRARLPIVADVDSECGRQPTTGLARALLPEIAESLRALRDSGTESMIDLRSLPMTDGDRSELATMLGRGEISMIATVAGESELLETGYSGVWWVRHRGIEGDVIAEFIEIAAIPAIAVCHLEDIKHSCRRLADRLDGEGATTVEGAQ